MRVTGFYFLSVTAFVMAYITLKTVMTFVVTL